MHIFKCQYVVLFSPAPKLAAREQGCSESQLSILDVEGGEDLVKLCQMAVGRGRQKYHYSTRDYDGSEQYYKDSGMSHVRIGIGALRSCGR